MESEWFVYVPMVHAVMCRCCEYAVRPKQIASHLHGTRHRMPAAWAQAVAEAVARWEGVEQESEQMILPSVVEEPIPHLPLHADGLQCRLQPTQCTYICRTMRSMKEHWRCQQGWSIQGQAGGLKAARQGWMQVQMDRACQAVWCQ